MANNSYNPLPFLDLTRLGSTDTERDIAELCLVAKTIGPIAAVCVFPQFVKIAVKELADTTIKIATVANFPTGEDETNLTIIQQAINDGADEIDWVLPYKKFLNGDDITASLDKVRAACAQKKLKIIIESGAYPNLDMVTKAANAVIACGADFVKTSTGKIAKGADLDSARAILLAIKNSGNKNVGIKLSGGIRKRQQAEAYIQLVVEVMGDDWLDANHFRLGCSKLPD